MGKYHGKNGHLTFDGVELSMFLTDISLEESMDTAEVSTMGDSAKEYVEGLSGGSLSLSGVWDDTATTGPDAVLQGAIGTGPQPFIYGPSGDTAAMVKYTGDAILTAYSRTTPIGGAVAFTATLQVTGAVTRGVFPV